MDRVVNPLEGEVMAYNSEADPYPGDTEACYRGLAEAWATVAWPGGWEVGRPEERLVELGNGEVGVGALGRVSYREGDWSCLANRHFTWREVVSARAALAHLVFVANHQSGIDYEIKSGGGE